MDYESICCSLQTVRAARMFYEYGKLDRLLERDITTSSDDLYEVYYELLIAATDYMNQKFNEDYEYDHWYFSFRSMMQYYGSESRLREPSQHEALGKSIRQKSRGNALCYALFLLSERRYGLGLPEKDQLRVVERPYCRNRRLFSL